MLKNILHKVRHNPVLMVLACVAPVVIVIGIFSLFRSGTNNWFWLLTLLCPLAHIFMMRDHKHNHDGNHVHDHNEQIKKVEQK